MMLALWQPPMRTRPLDFSDAPTASKNVRRQFANDGLFATRSVGKGMRRVRFSSLHVLHELPSVKTGAMCFLNLFDFLRNSGYMVNWWIPAALQKEIIETTKIDECRDRWSLDKTWPVRLLSPHFGIDEGLKKQFEKKATT